MVCTLVEVTFSMTVSVLYATLENVLFNVSWCGRKRQFSLSTNRCCIVVYPSTGVEIISLYVLHVNDCDIGHLFHTKLCILQLEYLQLTLTHEFYVFCYISHCTNQLYD